MSPFDPWVLQQLGRIRALLGVYAQAGVQEVEGCRGGVVGAGGTIRGLGDLEQRGERVLQLQGQCGR